MAFHGRADAARARGVAVHLPPIPDIPGVDIRIEIAGVPAAAALSRGRPLPNGVWLLRRDEASGLRYLPSGAFEGGHQAGPVSLRVTYVATDRATGRARRVSAAIDIGSPWLGQADGGLRYRLVDDADGRFEIDPVSGLVTVADESLLDHTAARSHRIVVETFAPDGSVSTRRFDITLLDDAGEFSISDAPDDSVRRVTCHTATGTVVGAVAVEAGEEDNVRYGLADDAGGRFAIDASTGVVTVADGALLGDGAAPSHSITVMVASRAGWTSTQRFSIAPGDGEGTFVVSAVSEGESADGYRRRLAWPMRRPSAEIAA